MRYFTIQHTSGSIIKIKDIGITLSQSCQPFEGVFARMAYDRRVNDLADHKQGSGGGKKGERFIRPKIEVIDPNRKSGAPVEYDEDKECQFLRVEYEGNRRRVDDEEC